MRALRTFENVVGHLSWPTTSHTSTIKSFRVKVGDLAPVIAQEDEQFRLRVALHQRALGSRLDEPSGNPELYREPMRLVFEALDEVEHRLLDLP